MLLATDLDGTFLGGSPEDRQRLYQLVSRHPDIRLVFVTGRGLESVLPLLSDPAIPTPDFIICDVGATVVDAHTLQPVQPLQAEIGEHWPGDPVIAAALETFGLQRQDVPQERRYSYFCGEAEVSDELKKAVADLGCDLLYSAGLYLDILPRGVNKGTTLMRLVEHLGVDPQRVLVAGDTLNDLAMYEQPFKGVCVADSEAKLLDATRNNTLVLHAGARGCGGILEAITHFGFLGNEGIDAHANPSHEAGKSDLVIVYHRLPYEEFFENGKLVRRSPSSPNGILPTLLSFFADGRRGAWVAWAVDDPKRGPFELHTPVDAKRYPRLTAARVPLSKQDVDVFYRHFSKEAFWPMLHTFWERARFREDHWQIFCRVNRAFAERTASEAAEGAVVWLHDYNLWMVPAYLRELRPDLKIAFFHHTYFPSADVFNVVPWRRAIIGSLLQCDYVGFHIPRQVENFVDVVRGAAPVRVVERQSCAPRFVTYGCAVGLEHYTTEIAVGDRHIRLGAHPVGMDMDRVAESLARQDVQKRMAELRASLKGQRLILSIERLDYTKGTLEKLGAFEQLLVEHPELVGKVTLITVCVPAAKEMTVYRQLQRNIEEAVGRINGRFSRVGWTPVQFFARALPFHEVVSYYAMADLMWITPLRDGLNLVCKEYVATQGLSGGRGVLVLSEFAGAAAELKGAILTNPHDIEDLKNACYIGLNIGQAEAEARLRQLFDIVRHYDNRRWGEDFLEAVSPSETAAHAASA
ncbi:glucosylglycerol-phosphate synthase [Solimonas terrae]|uniref:Glucosylglycerol-phosphate synthase n=1 Tax=Solimonas terrae TaxID=1396819 RepID=A0A6M2BPG7_9GAMM|nr:glucosylglycerol-phosphate synthase [Solimonas terrae]NGY04512.1 glucosylglycerol-phosphate synthase [Solimonas terrae]